VIAVHLLQVPPEGLHVEGDEDAGFLDLADIGARPASPVHYAMDVGLSGGGLFATGRIGVKIEMTCVACLRPFVLEINIDPFALQVEIDGRELVDLTPLVREEILLALPNHPRCDLISGHTCPYHPPESGESRPTTKAESAWDQLDKLKLKR